MNSKLFDKFFEELKNQILIINPKEHEEETKDNFKNLKQYWETKGINRLAEKIERNKETIKFKNLAKRKQ